MIPDPSFVVVRYASAIEPESQKPSASKFETGVDPRVKSPLWFTTHLVSRKIARDIFERLPPYSRDTFVVRDCELEDFENIEQFDTHSYGSKGR
jgi:hypothetical protein